MKTNQKKKKKKSGKRIKKTIFSLIVILIVLSFAASFFASGLSSGKASAAQATAQITPEPAMVLRPTATPAPTPTPVPTPDENIIQFLAAVKESMVASEDPAINATLIVSAINVYNSLYEDDMIIVEKTADAAAIEKLTTANIYFDEIAEDIEQLSWEMVTVDENGIATVVK